MIFQCLPFQSKLIFGRCNKRLIQERDAAFSWKHVESEPIPCFSDGFAFFKGFSNSCKIFKISIPIELSLVSCTISPQLQDALQHARVKEILVSNYFFNYQSEFDDSSLNFLINKISSTVQTLELPEDCLSSNQILQILQACARSPTLKSLRIEFDHRWDDQIACCVFDLISQGQLTSIEFAGVYDKSISPEWFHMLCVAIRKNKNLTEFNFNQFHWEKKCAKFY